MKFEIGFEKFSQEAVFLENRTLGFIGNLHLQQGLGPDRFFFWIWIWIWLRTKKLDPDLVCYKRLDPDPDLVCYKRMDLDPVNIRPDPQPWPPVPRHLLVGRKSDQSILVTVHHKEIRYFFVMR